MNWLLTLAAGLALVFAIAITVRARFRLRHTTLVAAVGWAVFTLVLWALTWIAAGPLAWVAPGIADQLWYATAVVALCPFVAVLGARRPGARVWAAFVLLPLILVFGWPALTVWNADLQPARLHVETPMLLGYGFVLLMGSGNYFGTRHTTAALSAASALLLLVVPFSEGGIERLPAAGSLRAGGTWLIGLAVLLAARSAARPVAAHTAFDRLWLDFRDSFGVVWAKRVLERLNEAGKNEGWPVRLELDGFVRADGTPAPDIDEQTSARLEHTLRWLLRRFVDSEWIDERLHTSA